MLAPFTRPPTPGRSVPGSAAPVVVAGGDHDRQEQQRGRRKALELASSGGEQSVHTTPSFLALAGPYVGRGAVDPPIGRYLPPGATATVSFLKSGAERSLPARIATASGTIVSS